MYNIVDTETIRAITNIAGEENTIVDKDKMLDYSHDEFSLSEIARFPEIVVKPQSRDTLRKIVMIANQKRVPVTSRGGGTGLCGGCVPFFGGIVVSFENMKRIIEIDKKNLMAVVEPGVTLAEFYKEVEGAGLFFPPHPGDESATIGGAIATNAGGSRAVRYGTVKNFVTGLEVVLSDGEIIELGGKIIKNSSGYRLLDLMIGSEGTLGIITKAVLRLLPPPQEMFTLICPYDDLIKAIGTVPVILKNGIIPVAVEFMEREAIDVAEEHLGKKWPCPGGEAHLMIIVEGSGEEILNISGKIADICVAEGAKGVFVADTKGKQENILYIRSQIYEALKKEMLEILDISVPPSEIASFVSEVRKASREYDIWLPTYGHAADGNVHTHIMKSRRSSGEWEEIQGWREKYKPVRDKLHRVGKSMGGVISGEHGIGLVKRDYLEHFLGEKQIEIMKGIKKVFDPGDILNPGKILP